MRILMLSWEYPPKVVGGLARHVQELSEALAERGHEVHVLTSECAGEPQDAQRSGVWVHRTRSGYPATTDFYTSVLNLNFAMLERALALGPALEPALLHAHDWLVAYAAAALKHAWRRPLLATIHATEWGRNGGLHNDLSRRISDAEWWLAYEAWRVIACSYHMRDEIHGIFQVPRDKLVVLPNGVRRKLFRRTAAAPAVRARFAGPGEKLVLFVGRLVREKGPDVLLEAVPKILRYAPGTRFVLAGTGPLAQELRERAAALGVADRVSLPGFVDDATRNALLATADVAVYPSTYEPFGIVALEAMAAGTPVVVSDTGGMAEIVVHGVNGLKAFPGDPNSLADNVLTLLHQPDLARELAEQALEDVRECYDWAGIARGTEAVYEKVLAEYAASPWADPEKPAEAGADGAQEPEPEPALVGGPRLGHFPEQLSAHLPPGWSPYPGEREVVSR
ncbi:MAG TPA: glycosyltransferase family 4 protein [Firmicutes bacterium]|nr:glycosyltransferase family 4 protein [Bacillota bacterium]